MTNEIATVQNSDLVNFSDEDIARAGLLLKCGMDKELILKALVIQRDTGLSMSRGELSVMQFKGAPTITINKQGYLAYASKQPDYEGYEWGLKNEDKPLKELKAWVKVYRTGRRPTYEEIDFAEFSRESPVWKQMPKHMLKVRCVSLALREAFPVLNGTLTDDEVNDERFRIDPLPTDIDVEPVKLKIEPANEPAAEPAKESAKVKQEPVKKAPAHKYVRSEVQKIHDNYIQHGWPTDIIEKARFDSDTWDKDMIDADFKQRIGETAQAKTEPQPPKEEPASVCPICGKPSMTIEEARHMECLADTKDFDHTMCKDCTTKWYKDRQDESAPEVHDEQGLEKFKEEIVKEVKSKQTKPSVTLSGDVCEKCGCKLLESDLKTSKDFCDGHLFCETHRLEYIQAKMDAKKGGSQ